MLLELEIENFALVQRLSLTFEQGLNVLTGETGAGKSIILDSLDFLLGGEVRDPAQRQCASRVSGRFIPGAEARRLLADWDLLEGEQILLSREFKSGRSSCRINHRLATIANLRELGRELVDLHGQHQHQMLQRPSRHLEMVDRLAGDEHLALLGRYRDSHARARELEQELEALRLAERDRIREIEWLEKEVLEIDRAQPRPGEEEELETELARLSAAEALESGAAQAHHHLVAEGAAADQVARASRALSGLIRHDPRLESFCQGLAEAEIALVELGRELCSYTEGLLHEPARLDELQERLEQLKKLKRKYGADLGEVLEYRRKAGQRLEELRGAEARMEGLHAERARARERRDQLAASLREARGSAARTLESQVSDELRGLGMERVRFEVRFERLEEPGPGGAEVAQFYMSPNPGTPPGPLARVASGGELSRVMLALISLFSRYAPVPTMVFDEIDAGLGGRAAEAVARRLRDLANRCQVLCVTHLAVIAAGAGHHLKVHKTVTKGQTRIALEPLEPGQRELEIARMLSGDATPDAACQHARELIARNAVSAVG
ncbi:MAG: DNA repair protein RecN [Armatimonadetes bacterium]|nr:DNA repair protein RecN [Armatimonadota bacterium]